TSFGAANTILRIAVADRDEKLVGRAFSGAVIQTGLCSYPGLFGTSPPGGATSYETYIPAVVAGGVVTAHGRIGDDSFEVPVSGSLESQELDPPAYAEGSLVTPAGDTRRVALGTIAGARSGDKGGHANVGVWVRSPEAYEFLSSYLTTARVRELLPGAEELQI